MNSFHATLKLITSEEVLGEVLPGEDEGVDYFVVSNPITICENNQVDAEKGIVTSGLVPRKWMLYSNQDLVMIYKQHVISISELDKFGIEFYKRALVAAKVSSPIKKKVDTKNHSGYVGTIDKLRKRLKRTFDNSPDLTTES